MRFLIILLLSFCFACNYFQKTKLDSKALLDQELKTFKWDQVDQYPTFETCQADYNFEQNKRCFESTLIAHVSKVLNLETVKPILTKNDTLKIKFLVSKNGVLTIPKIGSQSFSEENINALTTILTKSLEELPLLFPAVKRSQQVQSEFQLPIILNLY